MNNKIVERAFSHEQQALFDEALALHRRENLGRAIKLYQKLHKKVPDHPRVLNLFGLATGQNGDLLRAAKILERATQVEPGFGEAWLNLGDIQLNSSNYDAAANSYEQACRLIPDSAASYLKYANASLQQGEHAKAVDAYETSLKIDPENPVAWRNLTRAGVLNGDWNKAIEASDKALAYFPGNVGLLSLRSEALLEQGRSDDLTKLVDFDHLIETREFPAPNGFSDLKAFNAALSDHCIKHPSLVYEPEGKSTTKGHQTSNFALDTSLGPIAPLMSMIDQAVRDYQLAHLLDDTHPFLAHHPANWDIDIWGTILGSQGHQIPHIHYTGWLSGVYYARMPDCALSSINDQAGWIEFGRPPERPKAKAAPVVRAYEPKEGMVVLFPSYFYHRTLPFESDDKRISIAFDINPST